MDQSGEVLPRNGLAENKLLQGVTTAIAGEGGTPVPAEQIDAYFRDLETSGISLNFGTYYSSAQARVAVMGDGAGAPTPAQLEKMKELVATAMRAGAVGIATALIYPPDSFQSTQDLIELAKVAAQYNGIYASHMRDESAALLSAIGESIQIGEQAGIQVEVFHFKGAYQPGWGQLVPQAIALIDGARARGVNIGADMYLVRRRRHRSRHHGAELGLGTRRGAGPETAAQPARPRAAQARAAGRLAARLVESRARVRRLGSRRARERVRAALRRVSLQEHRGHRSAARKRSRRRCLGHPARSRAEERAMALFFMMSEDDIETGAQGAVDGHRQRCGRGGTAWRDGCHRPAAPARIRQFPTRDRRVRAQAQGAYAGGRRA